MIFSIASTTSVEGARFYRHFNALSSLTDFGFKKKKIAKLPNGFSVFKYLVNSENIGTVFYLFGLDRYPDYKDFKKCKDYSKLEYKNVYNGWLRNEKVSMLKVLHLISYLKEDFNYLTYPNNTFAETMINRDQVNMLVKNTYSIDDSSSNSSRLKDIMTAETNMLAKKFYRYSIRDYGTSESDFDDNSSDIYNFCTRERCKHYPKKALAVKINIDKFIPGFTEMGKMEETYNRGPREFKKDDNDDVSTVKAEAVSETANEEKKEEKITSEVKEKEANKESVNKNTVETKSKSEEKKESSDSRNVRNSADGFDKLHIAIPSKNIKNTASRGIIINRIRKFYNNYNNNENREKLKGFDNLTLVKSMNCNSKSSEFILINDEGKFYAFASNNTVSIFDTMKEAIDFIISKREVKATEVRSNLTDILKGVANEIMPNDVKETLDGIENAAMA